MHATNIKKYKDVLERKRDELAAAPAVRTPAGEPGSKSGDWIDQSSQENEIHVRLALKQTDSKLLRAIEEAKAAQEWADVEFWERKGKPHSVATYCRELLRLYPNSSYAARAREKLAALEASGKLAEAQD